MRPAPAERPRQPAEGRRPRSRSLGIDRRLCAAPDRCRPSTSTTPRTWSPGCSSSLLTIPLTRFTDWARSAETPAATCRAGGERSSEPSAAVLRHARPAQGLRRARRAGRRSTSTSRRTRCVVLIGASGSGKSTLLRCVNLLETVDDGVIELRRRGHHRPPGRRGRRPAPDRHRLPGVQPVPAPARARQRHARAAQGARSPRDEAEAQALDMLERVGLRDKARGVPRPAVGRAAAARRHRPGAGQRPRAACCFDEVTSALDPELVGRGARRCCGISRTDGMTMIVATHEMGFARRGGRRGLLPRRRAGARARPGGAGPRGPDASPGPASSSAGSSRPAGSDLVRHSAIR